MGGNVPSRTLIIENESNIIKVSDDVVERIKKAAERSSDSEKSEENISEKEVSDKPVRYYTNAEGVEGGTMSSYPYLYGPPATSLQVVREKELELKETEKYWSERVRKLEEQQAKTNRVMEQEYEAALHDLNNQLPKFGIKRTDMPCTERKQSLLECYMNHPREALRCAKQVSDFVTCIDHERLK